MENESNIFQRRYIFSSIISNSNTEVISIDFEGTNIQAITNFNDKSFISIVINGIIIKQIKNAETAKLDFITSSGNHHINVSYTETGGIFFTNYIIRKGLTIFIDEIPVQNTLADPYGINKEGKIGIFIFAGIIFFKLISTLFLSAGNISLRGKDYGTIDPLLIIIYYGIPILCLLISILFLQKKPVFALWIALIIGIAETIDFAIGIPSIKSIFLIGFWSILRISCLSAIYRSLTAIKKLLAMPIVYLATNEQSQHLGNTDVNINQEIDKNAVGNLHRHNDQNIDIAPPVNTSFLNAQNQKIIILPNSGIKYLRIVGLAIVIILIVWLISYFIYNSYDKYQYDKKYVEAETSFVKKEYQRALTRYNEVYNVEKNPEILYKMALIYLTIEKDTDSYDYAKRYLETIDDINKLDTTKLESIYSCLQIYSFKNDKYTESEIVLNALLKRTKDVIGSITYIITKYREGLINNNKGDFVKAVNIYSELLNYCRDSNDSSLMYSDRSWSKKNYADYNGAEIDINKAIKLNPSNPTYYFTYAEIFRRQIGFDFYYKNTPFNNSDKKKLEIIVSNLLNALKYNHDDPGKINYWCGLAYKGLGNKEKAYFYLNKAIELGNTDAISPIALVQK